MEKSVRHNSGNEPNKRKHSWVIVIVVLVFVCFCTAILFIFSNNDGSILNARLLPKLVFVTQTTDPTIMQTEIPLAPSFETIQTNRKEMTEVQWKDFLPTLNGMRVLDWQGNVVEVDKTGSSYNIWVDMNPEDSLFSEDGVLSGLDKDEVIDIAKGSRIEFSGIIIKLNEILNNATILITDVNFEIND